MHNKVNLRQISTRLPLFLVAAFVLIAAFALPSYAQNRVSGTVRDQNGDAVAGARVTVRSGSPGLYQSI